MDQRLFSADTISAFAGKIRLFVIIFSFFWLITRKLYLNLHTISQPKNENKNLLKNNMRKLLTLLVALLATTAWAATVTDLLTGTNVGNSGSTSYTEWSNLSFTSAAVYAGQSAYYSTPEGGEAIQIRSNNKNSGIVTTASGGKIVSITVVWHPDTYQNRVLNIYGKNTAYSAATDLYDTSIQGTKLGTLTREQAKNNTETATFTVSGDYAYIGLCSNDGAQYFTSISIVWETGSGTQTTVESPTFSPAAGTYTEAQSVTINCATSGATIHYTTDGSMPTSASAAYSAAIPVSVTTTVKAIAVKDGMTNSAVASATYTINSGGSDGETYEKVTSISSSDVGKEFILVYESTPAAMGAISTTSTKYGLSISGSNNLIKDGTTITIPTGSEVEALTLGGESGSWTFKLSNGNYLSWTSGNSLASSSSASSDNQKWVVTISSGAAIIKNKADNTRVIKYNNTSGQLRFACYTSGQQSVALYRKSSGSTVEQVATPTFSPTGGTYTEAQSVTINCATSGATIHYTTDGTTPTTSSASYSGAISVSSTTTIKAIAVKSGMTNSEVTTATYTINLPQVETPTFSPAAGTYTSAQSVTISSATSGATIHYTTDGSSPTTSSATYSGAISVSSTTTIKAIAVKSGMTNSEVATATYTINLPQVETPTFSPAAGTYTSAQSVTINCATSGATIHYTTDGSTPTTSSATYSGAISVSSTTTIKAIAVKSGMTNSQVAAATYTIEAGSSGGGDGLTYEKVTSISSSDVGKKFIIVYEETPAVMGTISSTSTTYGQSITGTSNFTLSDSQITLTSNSSVAPLTLGGTSGAWTFLFEDGKYMSWSSGNSLASETSVSTNSQWAVTFSDGVPTIVNGHDNTRKLQYNSASNSLRFACYTSSQQSVALYRQVGGGEEPVVEQVATPVISPSDGTVITGPTSVSISCTTDGATIHYTTDGSTPTSTSETYSAAFNVSATTTVKAIAVKSGMTDSEVASAIITYQAPVTNDEYTLVTDDSTLASGDIVIIVSNGAGEVMTAGLSGSSTLAGSSTDVTISSDKSTVTLGDNAEALVLVLEGSSDAWKFRSGSNYLYANSASNSVTMASDNSTQTHTIEIGSDATATIKSGTGSRFLQYNYNNGSTRFGTYASSFAGDNKEVQIYRQAAAASSVTTVTGIAAFKEVTAGETVRLYLPDSYNARVLHATQTASNATAGTYTYDAYVRDNSGAMLIKGLVTTREMAHDQHIAGWLMGQYTTASDGNPQLTPDLCQSTDRTHCPWFVIADPVSETATEPVAVAATEVAGHAADWVKVSNVKIGTTSLTLTNAFNASYNVYNGALVDVSAIATPTAVYPVALGDEPVITHVVDATQAFVSPSSSISDVEVRLAKPFTAGVWTPLTVPFDITEFDGVIMEYIGVQQGDPVTAPSGRQFDAGNMIFEQATSIQAGVPYLVKAHDTTSGMTFSGVTLSNESARSVTHTVNVSSATYNAPRRVSGTDEYTMTGTYSPTSVSTADNSVKVMTDDGSVGWASALGGNVDGSSAYFTTPADQALRIVFDGDSSGTITGINDILAEGDTVAVEGTYNLMGVRMTGDWQSLPAGIYIVNGKKTVKQ